MRRKIIFFIIGLFALNLYIPVFATDEEECDIDENVCSTGSLEMDAEQLSSFKENIPMIIDVKPNQLFNIRLNDDSDKELSGSGINIASDGDEIITSLDNDMELMNENDNSIYPSKVDNSVERTFPVIKNQGYLNSCLGWSLAYYQLTNNANKIRGTYARRGSSNIDENIYSPNWIYNLGNLGNNSGMYGDSAVNVLYTYGCPTINKVPIKTSAMEASNYLSWYPTSSIWESALYNKCDLYYGTINPDNIDTPITSPQSNYLTNLKKLLADGYVVTIETYANPNGDVYLPIVKTGVTSEHKSAYVWTEVRYAPNSGHAVTIVGYDDNFKVDINGDGSYQTGEYGAFKLANSWGTNIAKHNDGYVWLAYDALNSISSVLNSNNDQRTSAFRNGDIYYFIKPQKEYKPLLTATVEISTRYRDGLKIKLGIVDTNNPQNYYEKYITEASYITDGTDNNYLNTNIAFNTGCGAYDVKGTNTSPRGYFTFDITSLLSDFELQEGHNYSIYIELLDYSNGGTTTLRAFRINDLNTENTLRATGLPISTSNNNNTLIANVAHVSSIMSVKNDKTFTLTFNSPLNKDTVSDMNVWVRNSNNDDIQINLSTNNNDEKIYLLSKNNLYDNGFYTLNISTGLKSKGGNGLSTNMSIPFYVPFH